MVCTVPGKESDGDVVVCQDRDRGGGWAPWCSDVESCNRSVSLELLDAGAAYYRNVDRFCRRDVNLVGSFLLDNSRRHSCEKM